MTRLRIGRFGVRMPQGARAFYVPQNVHTGSEAQSARHAMSTVLVPGLQQLVHEADHSYPPTAKVKNEWSYISTTPYAFMTWTGKILPFYHLWLGFYTMNRQYVLFIT